MLQWVEHLARQQKVNKNFPADSPSQIKRQIAQQDSQYVRRYFTGDQREPKKTFIVSDITKRLANSIRRF
ncbi:MAG: hypothetical protein DRQ10_06990 [Candidatus Hydrothermota bacterium]|nr:MAG: hypothetical protein DRQ10_06990 [Candidatus Hydrothermae bacterium]